VVIAELKVGGVAMQVLLAAVLIHTLHPALEDRKEAFQRIRVC
jgi:hypothetical protein